MLEIIELLTYYLVTLIKLLKPGGVKRVMAQSVFRLWSYFDANI